MHTTHCIRTNAPSLPSDHEQHKSKRKDLYHKLAEISLTPTTTEPICTSTTNKIQTLNNSR